MNQHKYQPISTIKISAKGEFHWVKCPSKTHAERACLLQCYHTDSPSKIIESVQWEIDKILELNHPQLQSVIDIFATDKTLSIVQELEQWDCAIAKVPYTPTQAKNLLQELTPALIYLHDRGITHGNISPESIVINHQDSHILTNFLTVVKIITEVGGDTYPLLRSQLAEIPILDLPTGQAWDLYSLGVTVIALLTNRDYRYLYDSASKKWNWSSYVDCSEELTRAIDRLLGQEKQLISLSSSGQDYQIDDHNISDSERQKQPQTSSKLYRRIVGSTLLGISGLVGYSILGKLQDQPIIPVSSIAQSQPFPQNKILTVGYINRVSSRPNAPKRDYSKLQSYLETEIRKKYGQDFTVRLEPVLTTREAQGKIEQKKWDVAFTASATNAIIAEDNKYEFVARMSANEDPYRDVCFFVKKDSKINSSKYFRTDQRIALPNDDSPLFVMPLYDLYGKKMLVSIGNTSMKIEEKVKSGEADIGVGFCKNVAKDASFKALSPNRIIPVGGVFLSPKISQAVDREYITEAIIKAPAEIQTQANYTRSSGINYTQFRRINDRAALLLNCVDLTRNPVEFYCNKPPSNPG